MTRRIPCLVLALAALLASTSLVTRVRAAAPDEHWKGAVNLPGTELPFMIHFAKDEAGADTWTATLDIPMQGVTGAKMVSVINDGKEIAFTFAQVGAVFKATINDDGQIATGTLRQSGQTFPLTLTRLTDEEAAAAVPKRPQTPQPPFPYEVREVTYKNEVDGITIAGTLTLPDGDGPFPAVVMITGSGAQDRDEAIMGHQPFWVIADHLSRHGVAVLRSDDRGIGGTGGNIGTSTSENFALDALAGVTFLKGIDRINPAHIGVMGHSEGGIVGPIAAVRSNDVAFVIMLAGTGLPGNEILTLQSRLMMEATGAFTDEQLDEMTAKHRALMEAIINDKPQEEKIEAMMALIQAQGAQGDDARLRQAAAQQLVGLHSPWFKYFLTYDPRPTLRRVTCPVLALNGSIDLQVPADEDLAEIRKALTEAGNKDFTVTKLEGLNHLFQHATTGSVSEYATIEETFSPEALDLITGWINERFGVKGHAAEDPATVQ